MLEYKSLADIGLKPQQARRRVMSDLEKGISVSIAELGIVLTPEMLPAIHLWDAIEKKDAAKRTKGGRPSALSDEDKEKARGLWIEGVVPTTKLTEQFGLSRASMFRLFGPRRHQD